MPYVTTPSVRLFYVRRPSRQPESPSVLFIHGAGGNALLWGRVLNRLPSADCIALDLPGHGRSSGPACSSIQAHSAAVLGLATALGLHDLVVVGHSMGGAVALQVALSEPSRVRALVLLSTSARLFVAPALLEQLAADPAQAREWIVEAGYGPETPAQTRLVGARQLAQVPPEVLHGDFMACSNVDYRNRLVEVRCPALVLCGSEDRLTPPRYVRALQEGLPAARFELIPRTGHMLPLECPEAVAEAIARFLDSPVCSIRRGPPA